LFKKIISATRSACSLERFAFTVNPAVEKMRSDGAELAGIQRSFFAKQLNKGYDDACSFHQSSGSSLRGSNGAFMKVANSC